MSRQPTIDNILPWAAHGYARENQPFRGLATHVVVANQLRRGLLPGAALLAGGATIIRAAHGTPSDFDAQLLRLYAAIMEQGAEIGGLLAYGRKLPRGPEKDAHDEHFDAADSAWFDLIEEIAQTPARTQAGLRAKAAALQLVGKADGPAERLALSLATVVTAVSRPWTLSCNFTPERRLSTVLPPQPADVDIVRLEDAVIRDRCSQTLAIPQMPGSMSITAGPTLGEREVDHCSQ